MTDAFELVLRSAIAALCGWLVQRGFSGLSDPSIVTALTTIAGGVILWLLTVSRGLAKSTVTYMLARLQARHKTALVAEAAKVPGVQSITADAALADAIPSDKVVAS